MPTGKTIALTRQTFVDKVMSLLFNMLSRLVITFLPRSKHLLVSRLQSPCSDFGGPQNKVSHCFHCFPIYLQWSNSTGSWDLESPLDCKEIQPVHSEGDQPWDFFGRNDAKAETPVLWPPHGKRWLIGKDSDAGRDWGQEEKGTTEDEMAGWHHWLDGHESEWTPGVGDGQGAWRASIHAVAKSRTWLSGWTELNWWVLLIF